MNIEEKQIAALDKLLEIHRQRIPDNPASPLAEKVHEYVTKNICAGKWAPGEKVIEAKVAKALGISHVPVREAMAKLQHEGWVERVLNRGVFVKKLDIETIYHLCQVREILEVAAVGLVAETLTDEQLAELKEVLCLNDSAHEAGNSDVAEKTDIHFHRLLVHFTNNPKLEAMFESVLIQSRGYFFIITEGMPFHTQAICKRLKLADHLQIHEALAAHDAQSAEMLVKEHIMVGRTIIVKLWELLNEVNGNHDTFKEIDLLASRQLRQSMDTAAY